MSSLSRKVVMITGASSGIGEGIANHFASCGTRLVLCGRNVDNLERVAAACRDLGTSETEVITIVGDITKDGDRKNAISQTTEHFGKLDVLVNNAAILKTVSASKATAEDFDSVFDINLKALMLLTNLAIPHLKESKGNIVNTSSLIGTQALPFAGLYCMAKAALNMYTQCLALDLAQYGVRVNAICPGLCDTNMYRRAGEAFDETEYSQFLETTGALYPLGRITEIQDCANAAEFLASDAASFVTGQLLFLAGGKHCKTH